MSRPLRVLIVEDVEEDVLLTVRELERHGFEPEWRRVETAAELEAALEEGGWEIVLADYMLGGFTAPEALEIVRRHDPDLPFIVVSGSTGDHEAVEVMREGADDYFRKEWLPLLGPAVERELREAATRRARRAAEAELDLLHRALEASATAVMVTDRDGTIQWVNPAFSRLTGYSAEEAVGRNPRILKSGEHPEAFYRRMWATLLAGEPWHGEIVNRRKDGTLYTEEMTITPVRGADGEVTHFIAVKEDVTERKAMERALRESEERFRQAFLASPDPAAVLTLADARFVEVNEAFLVTGGFTREEVVGHTTLELGIWVDPEERERFRRELAANGRVRGFVARYRVRGGEIRTMEVSAVALEFRGEPHMLAISRDITDRLAMERALRESEERFRRFFELGLTANYIAEGDRIVACNARCAELLGFPSREELLAAPVTDLYPDPAARRRFLDRLRRERVIRGERMEYRRRDGSTVRVIEAAVGLFDEAGELVGVQGFMVDLSEQEELERRLLQAQKMEPVGRLAAGVAHDFNNILQAISTQLDLLALLRAGDAEVVRRAQEAKRAVERGANLTRQLLAFSRQEPGNPRPLDLAELVADLMKMLRRLVGEDLELMLRQPGGAVPVVADPGQLEQVVMNLVVNARDATPPGGRVVISVRRMRADDAFRAERAWADSPAYAVLEVADTGCGMSREVLAHIFEPFFTTKEPGKGTGLGLATVYGIVTGCGGMVEAASEPGKGSVFTVYLPLAEGAELSAGGGEERVEGIPRGGGELVLLAEDEGPVREAMAEALRAAGFRVVAAADGREAVERFLRQPEEVRVAVLDVMMPGFSGPRAAAEIARRRPDLPVVFVSGYPGETLAERAELPEGAAVLRKPVELRELVRVVGELLGRRGGGGGR